MPPLDRSQLAALTSVISEGSFDSAARALQVTPSAISQRIKALEQQMGQVLVRRGKPCSATESGQSLIRLALQIDLLEGETLAELGAAAAPTIPVRIPIVVNADSLNSWLLPVLAKQGRDNSLLLDLHSEDQDHSAALLRAGTVMAAITTDPIAVQGCEVRRLGSMRYLACASPDYVERYFPDGMTIPALADAPLLVFNRKDALQHQFLRKLTRRAITPPTHYIPASSAFNEAVRLGLGWGMVPEQILAEAKPGDFIDIGGGRHLDVALYWQSWRLRSPALSELTAAVTTGAAQWLRGTPARG